MGSALPVIHERDGGMRGKGCDFAYTCFSCKYGRHCIDRLKITTDTSTECKFDPSKFDPHPSVPLDWPKEPKGRQRKWKKPKFEEPEEFHG